MRDRRGRPVAFAGGDGRREGMGEFVRRICRRNPDLGEDSEGAVEGRSASPAAPSEQRRQP
jgi:hypothetical protein